MLTFEGLSIKSLIFHYGNSVFKCAEWAFLKLDCTPRIVQVQQQRMGSQVLGSKANYQENRAPARKLLQVESRLA